MPDHTYFFRLPELDAPFRDVWWEAVFSAAGLRSLTLLKRPPPAPRGQIEDPRLKKLQARLAARLSGHDAQMAWDEFDLSGRPPFHVKTWKALHAIPFGCVRSYTQVARAAGSPRACRASGQACAANPIIMFIPCHRVVSASGLGGFSCGLEWKERFLALEKVTGNRSGPHRRT